MAKFKVGDKVKDKSRLYMGAAKIVDETDDGYVIKFDSGPRDMVDEEWLVAANASCNATATDVVRSTNAVVRNALAARNAGIWESAKEAEDRSDVFVRAALGRTKYNFDTEAGTLREVIKLLASAEQTPKIKKNTEKLKGILSRVEKAAALFKGI